MTPKDTIRKMVNYLLRNSNNMSSPGLYNGKAGLSLSFFIASKYLKDELLEDRAYDLLQESIILKNNDLSFENGLAGVGYVIIYLTENKYVEADFYEIFSEQYEKIIKSDIEKDPVSLVNFLHIIYFLSKVEKIKKEDQRIPQIIKKIFEGLELFLTIQFYDMGDIQYIKDKLAILNIYKAYLKLIDYSEYNHFSDSLIEDYASLYRKGKIVSSFEIGYYLGRMISRNSIKGYEDIILANMNNGIKNIYPCTLSLKESIDLAKLIDNKGVNKFYNFDNFNDIMTIKNLVKTVDEKSYPLGYGAGLGRLLIYCINNDIELL